MRWLLCLTIVVSLIAFTTVSQAKKKEARKVQEVNFAEVDISGKVRNPDGAYLVQKKGMEFLPLFNMKNRFDKRIKDSVHYLRAP